MRQRKRPRIEIVRNGVRLPLSNREIGELRNAIGDRIRVFRAAAAEATDEEQRREFSVRGAAISGLYRFLVDGDQPREPPHMTEWRRAMLDAADDRSSGEPSEAGA